MEKQIIISIGREHGSEGHKIAELLAQKLDFPHYDKNIFEEIGALTCKYFFACCA